MNQYNRPAYPLSYRPLYRYSRYELEPYRRPLRRWANVIGGGMLMVNFVMLLVYYGLYAAFSLFDLNLFSNAALDLMDQVTQIVSYVLAFWVPTVFIVAMIRIPANIAFPMRRPRASITIPAVFVCLGVSMVGSLVTGIISFFFEELFGLVPSMPDMSSPEGTAANVVYILSMTVAPAIFEELLCRGVVMQSLRRFGDGFALVTSSILFGLMHGNLIQGPNAVLMGLAMGYFVLRTGSLIPGMVIHFVNNGLSVLFSYMMDGMTDQQAELLNAGVFGSYVVLGIIGLIFLAVKHGNLFRLAPSNCPLPTGRRYLTFFTAITVILFLALTVWLTATYFE